jgi:hypothetical protein
MSAPEVTVVGAVDLTLAADVSEPGDALDTREPGPDAAAPVEAPVEPLADVAVLDAAQLGPLTRTKQIELNTRQILAVLHMDAASARKLATRAARAGRGARYIPALLQQVVSAGGEDAPETLFRYRVGNNLEAIAPPGTDADTGSLPTE